MAPGCPTQVAEKPKTECGSLLRQVKAKADQMPRNLQHFKNLECKNQAGTINSMVEQPK